MKRLPDKKHHIKYVDRGNRSIHKKIIKLYCLYKQFIFAEKPVGKKCTRATERWREYMNEGKTTIEGRKRVNEENRN